MFKPVQTKPNLLYPGRIVHISSRNDSQMNFYFWLPIRLVMMGLTWKWRNPSSLSILWIQGRLRLFGVVGKRTNQLGLVGHLEVAMTMHFQLSKAPGPTPYYFLTTDQQSQYSSYTSSLKLGMHWNLFLLYLPAILLLSIGTILNHFKGFILR